MDKTFQQQTLSGLPRSSLGGTPRGRMSLPASNIAGIRKAGHAGSTFGTNSSVSSLKKAALSNSRFSLSCRSNQSILGIRSEYSIVENYGSPIPVVINEALTFKDGSHSVSANICKNGWSWVVQGRRLLMWQYKDSQLLNKGSSPTRSVKTPHRRNGALAQCRELTLPHSDIGHKASLISVFQCDGQATASCIAVSATGDVRYWTSIAHDSSSVDITNILDGQEFDKLLDLPQQKGYLLVTTTCSLVFLQVRLSNGRYVLFHKTIKQPSGFLGGLGKKFASILIGTNNSSDKEQCFVSMAIEGTTNGESIVALLSDRSLQRWRLSNNGQTEQLIYEDSEIMRKIRDEFKQKIWHVRLPTDNFEIDLHLLDMHTHKNKIYLLAGAVNSNHTPQMYYTIVVLSPEEQCIQLENFLPLKLAKFYSPQTEQECLNIRFIISRSHLYLYTPKVVYPLQLATITPTTDFEAEKVEFHLHDDHILSAGVCFNVPLFFSRTHGIVSVTPSDFDHTDFLNMSVSNSPDLFPSLYVNDSILNEQSMVSGSSEKNLHIFELDPDDLYNEFQDEVSHLKAAFIFSIKRNNNMATTIVDNLLQSIAEKESTAGLENNNDVHELDKIVITIAEDLAEDIPFSDPRWEETYGEQIAHKHALGSSRSMQILTQLKDKNLALRHFIEFLHATGLWEKLRAVPSSGGAVLKPTSYVLADLNEKIMAAIALRGLQGSESKVIAESIAHAVSQWNEQAHGNLTAQDIFYVKLCKFQDVFHAFADVADECISYQQQNAATVVNTIYEINTIVLEVLNQVLKFREKNATTFMLPSDILDSYEYLPWTAMSGSLGVRDCLSRLIKNSVRYGAHCATEAEIKQSLYQQVLEMIDVVLDGRKNYLESVRDTEKFNVLQQQFEAQRRDLITILIENRQYELAAKLAEKYLDFQCLIIICDETENQDRLNEYIKKFEEYNFSQFAINWHLRQNRQGEVFERFKGNQAALSQFMRDHPTLGWIQLIFNGDFERAAKVLFQLAQCETEFVQRKKTMLSLAKLSAHAAPDTQLTDLVESIITEMTIIEYQESLGENILNAFGYDVRQQKVLKVEEIINLLIAEENDTATEQDFRKALELLAYMEEPYEARHKIWCAAILRDNWTEYDANNAVNYIQNLLFFKLIEVCHLMDGECDAFLPPIDDFMHSSELVDLTPNKSFKYLLKLTYEYVYDSFKKQDELMDM